MNAITIGIDLAKSVFQVHGVDAAGAVVIRKKLRRAEVLKFSRPLRRAWSAWRRVRRRTSGRGNSPRWDMMYG